MMSFALSLMLIVDWPPSELTWILFAVQVESVPCKFMMLLESSYLLIVVWPEVTVAPSCMLSVASPRGPTESSPVIVHFEPGP